LATFEFKLPDLGEGVVEGEIVQWLVSPGDAVTEDQGLVELMTDKATVTVPTPRAGRVVSVHGKVGEMAKVNALLVTMDVEGGAALAALPSAHVAPAAAQAPAAAAVPVRENVKVLATPVTRRMAREHGIDLGGIAGSGPQGRVLKADLVAALESTPTPDKGLRERPRLVPLLSEAQDERIPLRGLRKKIAEKMVRSKFTAPHSTFVEEVDFTELIRLRKRLNASLAAAGEEGKLSFLPFFCKALVPVMREFPSLNANFDEASQELVVRGAYNFGIAAATEDGLTVPVVKHVDRLTVRQLASEITRLAEAARAKQLKMDELTGGTFTLTSLGTSGGLFATPIINHPEVAILGIHRIRRRPVVVDEQVVVRDVGNVSLSFDHRVIDGLVAADATYALIHYLEKPETLFLDMA
jgi:pyruvate dehydrogenase E2 component (dihydrolipoamide acetyltransferase)